MFNPEERPDSVLFHLARYRFVGRLLNKSDKVLDIGCGIGTGTHYLKDFCSSVIGIDVDSEAVIKAKSLYENDDIRFHAQDAEYLLYDIGCFDGHWWMDYKSPNVITSIDVIEHLEHPERFVEDVYEMLPESGVFICGTPRKQDIQLRNSWHHHEFEPDEFFELLESYFPRVFRFGMNEETVSVFNVDTCWYLWGVCIKL